MTCKEQLSLLAIQNDSPAPIGLVASNGVLGRVTLNWIHYPGAERYSVYRDGFIIATNIIDNAFTDDTAEPNVTYSYQVQALVGSCGSNLSESAEGTMDPGGYTFYSTFIAVDTQPIRFYIQPGDCEVDWGDGTWVHYGSTIVEGSPVQQDGICRIRSQFYDWQQPGPAKIRFYPADSANGHPNDYKEIVITYGDSLVTAEEMCQGLQSLETFYWLGTCKAINFDKTWSNCRVLTEHNFDKMDFSNSKSFDYTWENCRALTEFPVIDVSSAEILKETWFGCAGLTSFPEIDISHITDLNATWAVCAGLTSFPYLDTSNVEVFYNTWRSCSGIQKFPLLNFTKAKNIMRAWKGCILLDEYIQVNREVGQLTLQNVEVFSSAWSGCKNFVDFPVINVSKGKRFEYTWYDTGIIEFPDLSFYNGTNFQATFANNKNITAMTSDIGLSSNGFFRYTFYGCESLECITGIDTTGVDFNDPLAVDNMFGGCETLFRPNEEERNQLTTSPGLDWSNDADCPIDIRLYAEIEVVDTNIPIKLSVSDPFSCTNNGITTDYPAGEHTITPSGGDPIIILDSLEEVEDVHFSSDEQDKNDNYKRIDLVGKQLQDLSSFCKDLTNLESIEMVVSDSLNNLSYAFEGCVSLTSLDINGETFNVLDWSGFLKDCTSFIDIPELDVQGGTNFTQMFKGCISVKHLGSYDTQNCLDGFDEMFMNCSALVCLSEINTQGITRPVVDMFTGCGMLLAPEQTEQDEITQTGLHWINADSCPDTVPYPPQNFEASNNRWDGVNCTWNAPGTGSPITENYHIYRDDTEIASVEGTVFEYLDTTALDGIVYNYYVTASNSDGEGKKSNIDQGSLIIPDYDQDISFGPSNMNDFTHLYKSHITDDGELSSDYKC